METIGHQEIWSYYAASGGAKRVKDIATVRAGLGHRVTSFLELAKKVADLQFRNREHVLLFRGQGVDYLSGKNLTMLRPSIFRHTVPHKIPGEAQLTRRFEKLKSAERELVYRYENAGLLKPELLKRQKILRWSILQHYHVCGTPLLDVTHSLRIAASFASLKATADAFVFVLGVPNLSGAITASAEAGLQIVRLSSVCPPTVVRPHIQEGYLLGEYPDISKYGQKALYHAYEIDFGRRLVAKFRFDPLTFWKPDTFPKVEEADLTPQAFDDPLSKLADEVRQALLN
ncbi:MAG: FRG domain-containing protein [Pyrinomonadaceae bacterium]